LSFWGHAVMGSVCQLSLVYKVSFEKIQKKHKKKRVLNKYKKTQKKESL